MIANIEYILTRPGDNLKMKTNIVHELYFSVFLPSHFHVCLNFRIQSKSTQLYQRYGTKIVAYFCPTGKIVVFIISNATIFFRTK